MYVPEMLTCHAQISSKPSDMSSIYNVSERDPRRAPDLATRPTFGPWDVVFFLDESGTSLSKADEIIFGHWDDYADQAINTLHQMIKQTEELVFCDDEYTDLVRTFQAFPHRPNLLTVLRDGVYDEHESAVKALADSALTPVQKVWHLWATRVEAIHQDLAQKMSCCKLRLAGQDEGDFGLAHLSISSDLLKVDSLTGLLHKILDSASEPDGEAKTGLEAHMQSMGL